jgi:hypothetical protein
LAISAASRRESPASTPSAQAQTSPAPERYCVGAPTECYDWRLETPWAPPFTGGVFLRSHANRLANALGGSPAAFLLWRLILPLHKTACMESCESGRGCLLPQLLEPIVSAQQMAPLLDAERSGATRRVQTRSEVSLET